jgi:hypothetical protein
MGPLVLITLLHRLYPTELIYVIMYDVRPLVNTSNTLKATYIIHNYLRNYV